MSNKSTHSGETLSGEPDVNLSPEAFEEQMEEDRKEDPYLVRFDVDDPANPKVIPKLYPLEDNCSNTKCYRRTGPE